MITENYTMTLYEIINNFYTRSEVEGWFKDYELTDYLTTEQQTRIQKILNQNGVSDYSNYRYMSIDDLSKIGLKNMQQDVIISYGNSEVYSYEGLKYDGGFYYSIDEVEALD